MDVSVLGAKVIQRTTAAKDSTVETPFQRLTKIINVTTTPLLRMLEELEIPWKTVGNTVVIKKCYLEKSIMDYIYPVVVKGEVVVENREVEDGQ